MSFGEWIFWIYLFGCIVSWPIISRWIYRTEMDNEPFLAIGLGITICWFWPLFIPGYWIYEWMIKDPSKK